jgi:hypothetical protein
MYSLCPHDTLMCVQSLHARHTRVMIYIPYSIIFMPVPVAAPSKARVCGRSLAAIAGSIPSGVLLSLFVSGVCYRSFLLRAYHSSRGVLPLLVRVVAKPRRGETMTRNRVEAPQGRKIERVFLQCIGCYWGNVI